MHQLQGITILSWVFPRSLAGEGQGEGLKFLRRGIGVRVPKFAIDKKPLYLLKMNVKNG